jgi:hypothetical protein
MESWNLWYELGRRAKNAELSWFQKRLSEVPPTDESRISFIERELTIFRHLHLYYNEGDIFILFSRLERLENIISSV